MSREEKLLQTLGNQIAESVGTAPSQPPNTANSRPAKYAGYQSNRQQGRLPLEAIMPDPDQPRKTFDPAKVSELAQSIKQHGVLQPIRVRWNEEQGKWVIIYGESRYRAAKQVPLETIPCELVEDDLTDEQLRIQQLVENCQRSDLKPLEQAHAFQLLIDRTDWSAAQLAAELSLSKASIIRTLALLKLPQSLQTEISHNRLSPSIGYALSQLDDPQRQTELSQTIRQRNLSRDAAVKLIQSEQKPPSKRRTPHLVKRFKSKTGTVTVTIKTEQGGQTEIRELLEYALQQL